MDATNSQRARSPSFPVHTLAECIDRCRAIFQRVGRGHAVPAQIASALDLSDKSSHFFQLLGALKQFGLLEPLGPSRLVLSPAALDLVLLPTDSPQHARARRTCAKTPAVFSVIQRFFPAGASDQTLVHFLLTQHKFTRDSAVKCVQIFRCTQSDLTDKPADSISAGLKPGPETTSEQNLTNTEFLPRNALDQKPTSSANCASDVREESHREFVVHLTRGRQISLRIPTDLSGADFQLLRRQMELHLDVIEQTMTSPIAPATGTVSHSTSPARTPSAPPKAAEGAT